MGTALARSLSASTVPGSCLSDEDISALLDRRVPADEHERLLSHIAACDECLSRFRMTASLMEPARKSASRRWYGYTAGLAAMAAAVAAIILARHEDTPQVAKMAPPAQPQLVSPSTTTSPSAPQPPQDHSSPDGAARKKADPPAARPQPATVLALADAVYQKAAPDTPIPQSPARQYGFAASLPPHRAAFRTGMSLIDLAASLKCENREQSTVSINRIETLAGPDFGHMNAKQLPDLAPDLRRQNFKDLVTSLERHAQERGQLIPFRFGAFTEAGRIAKNDEIMKLLDRTTLGFIAQSLNEGQRTASVTATITRLDALLSSSPPDPRAVRRLLDELAEVY